MITNTSVIQKGNSSSIFSNPSNWLSQNKTLLYKVLHADNKFLNNNNNQKMELTFIMPGLVQEFAFMILKELYRRVY